MTGNAIALVDLASQINEQHRLAEQAARTAIEHAWNAGKLLLEAKAQLRHGEWLPWVEANCEVGARQAQKYMRLVKEFPKNEPSSHLSINQALEALAEPKEANRPSISNHRKAEQDARLATINYARSLDDWSDCAGNPVSGEDIIFMLSDHYAMTPVGLLRRGEPSVSEWEQVGALLAPLISLAENGQQIL